VNGRIITEQFTTEVRAAILVGMLVVFVMYVYTSRRCRAHDNITDAAFWFARAVQANARKCFMFVREMVPGTNARGFPASKSAVFRIVLVCTFLLTIVYEIMYQVSVLKHSTVCVFVRACVVVSISRALICRRVSARRS